MPSLECGFEPRRDCCRLTVQVPAIPAHAGRSRTKLLRADRGGMPNSNAGDAS
jgi:hypothetical protein